MNNKLYYNTPAKRFIEAQPIGNGSFGAMVYGGVEKDKISFNHDTLWSGSGFKMKDDGKEYEFYKKAQELVMQGDSKVEEAEAGMIDNFLGGDPQAYMPMCYLEIESDISEYFEYRKTLDMEKGVVDVRCKTNDDEIKKQYFLSHPDNCFAMSISAKKQYNYTLKIASLLKYETKVKDNFIIISGETPRDNPRNLTENVFDGTGTKFTCAFYVETDGEILDNGGETVVKKATDIKIYACAVTSFVSFDKLPDHPTYDEAVAKVAKVSEKGYEYLFKRHTEDFSKMFSRTVLDLNAEENTLSIDEELKTSDKSLALYEKYFNFGKYLIISGSRDENSQALGLQGIWNEDFVPMWNAAYTININLEMCYWPMLMCGYTECALPILNQLEKISVTGRAIAEKYYKANGYVGFHNSDIWGFATPPGKGDCDGCVYGYWSLGAAWLCRHAYEQYEYTKDEKLLTRIYPLLKGAAEFFLSVLTEYNGKLVVSPSTSPENFYLIGDRQSALGIYTTMSQTLVSELFANTKKLCTLLCCDAELIEELDRVMPKLDVFEKGSKGQLLEWDKENAEKDVHHRHVSHLYGLYPGEMITKEKMPEMYDACRKSLEIRGDNGTGWSLAWKSNLWAGLKDGNKALFFIDKLLKFTDTETVDMGDKGGTYANLFCAHPPFQIDGNFGAITAVARMLMQCEDGRIKLLPALPDKLKDGRMSGLMAKGNIRTEILWESGKLAECKLTSADDICVDVEYNGTVRTIHLTANKEETVCYADFTN